MTQGVPFSEEIQARIAECGVVAVLVLDRAADAVPLAGALLEGGVRAMELTLRTDEALDALAEITTNVPEMLAGVGTVLMPQQVRAAAEAGAAFGVAPGTNPRVLAAAREIGFSFAPGVATPSDIEAALESQCRLLKFFPAEPSGGLAYLTSMAAPYAHLGLQFIPLGGINEANMKSYLDHPLVPAVGGSWIASREMIRDGNWDAIAERARETIAIANASRNTT